MTNLKTNEQHIICEVSCKVEDSEAVKSMMLELVEPARAEKGCLYYNIFQNIANPTILYILDGWTTEAAVEAHANHPNVTRVMKKLSPLLLGNPKLTFNHHIQN